MIRKLVQFMERSKSADHNTAPIPTFELSEEPNLLKFLYALSIIIIAVYVFFIQVVEYRFESLQHTVKNSQAALIEITSNKVIHGKLFNLKTLVIKHSEPNYNVKVDESN